MNFDHTLEYTESELDSAFEWIFDLVNRCRCGGDLAPCDRMLAGIVDPEICEQVHLDLLLPIIRLTSSLRERLPSWRPARDSIARELGRRGEDVAALLVGLADGESRWT